MKLNNLRGYNGYSGRAMSLEEIAQLEGVTKERIRQIEKRALGKIQKYLKARFGDSITVYDLLPCVKEELSYD